MQTLSKSLQSKLSYLIYGILFAVAIITFRLFHLQVHLVDNFFIQSQKNFLRVEKVMPPRGNIIDCNGALLVTNRPVTNVYWQGSGKKFNDPAVQETLQQIRTITHLDIPEGKDITQEIKHAERFFKKILLASDVSFEQLSKLEELFPQHATIKLATDFERFYPYNAYASHILGYLSYINLEATGSMGLEKLFEEDLKGQPGSMNRTINSFGRHLQEVETKKALTGQTIQTTLDIELQHILETVFPPDVTGTFIVMNPLDGALVGLVSRPNFDPNMFLRPMTSEQWKTLQEKRPFLNRAFNACYPPGSIFKLVTVSAALEQNMITPESSMFCGGYTDFCNRQYWCACKEGHGELTTGQAVAKSCNILFFDIGKKIDINLLAHYAHIFGLGKKTGVMFSEKEGLIPSRQWKLATKGERWWQGETLSASIGQSFLLIPPIQAACMISAIFTGFLTKPRILTSEAITKTPLDVKPSTRSFLQKTMRWAVTQGTGHKVDRIKGIDIYAKTSTAQTSSLEKRLLGTNYLEHGWFVAYFTYKESNPLTIVILLENVGSSQISTQVVKDFLIEYKKLMDRRNPTPELAPQDTVPVQESSSVENYPSASPNIMTA